MADSAEDLKAIEQIRRGDEEGLRHLMSRHREALFRFAYRYTRNEADAAEIAVETFTRVYRNAGRFRPGAKVSTWLFAIARNLCIDHIRRMSRRRDRVSLDAPSGPNGAAGLHEIIPDPARQPAESLEMNEELNAIERAIDALPHRLKIPFIFCVLEEHSQEECAAMLNTNRKTVETRIYRARRTLKNMLNM